MIDEEGECGDCWGMVDAEEEVGDGLEWESVEEDEVCGLIGAEGECEVGVGPEGKREGDDGLTGVMLKGTPSLLLLTSELEGAVGRTLDDVTGVMKKGTFTLAFRSEVEGVVGRTLDVASADEDVWVSVTGQMVV